MALSLSADRSYHGTALSQIAEALKLRIPSLMWSRISERSECLDQPILARLPAVLGRFGVPGLFCGVRGPGY